MASLEALNEIVDKHGAEAKHEPQRRSRNETAPRLMQHAHMQRDDDVKLTGQKKHQYAKSGPKNQHEKDVSVKTQQAKGQRGDDSNAEAIEGQTQIIRTQVVAAQKQSNLLQQQSGLMQDQLQATQEMSDVMNRLAAYIQKQMTKPEPKIQESKGNTYEGEFTRVNDKQVAAQERQRSVMDEMRERRREAQRERARKQERDKRGRFKRNTPRKLPRIQRVGAGTGGGALEGLGGRLGGGLGRMAGGALLPLLTLGVGLFGKQAIDAVREKYVFEKSDSNMFSRGWQNTKDWLDDHKPGDPNNTVLDQMTSKSKNTNVALGQEAIHKDFGAISKKFESGGRGVGTVSSGKGDPGGVSYGAHQLNSNKGGMTNFLRSAEGAKYYGELRGLTPGSEEFTKKYKDIVSRDGKGMEQAQTAFIKRENYDPVVKWFEKQYGVDINKRSRAVQEAFFSVATQYGPGKAKGVMGDAFGNRDISKMDDAEFITRIQETRASTVEERFRNSSDDTKNSIYKRAGEEKVALLAMLNEERQGPGSAAQVGSGIGSQYSQKMIGQFGGKPAGGAGQVGTGAASNGTVGVMAMPQGGGGGATGAGDEAGGGTAAAMLAPAGGALYSLGVKHTRPNDNSVNMAGLNDKFKQAFYTMVGDWVQNNQGTVCNVASAFRTRAEQEALWIKYGRNTKRVARPGTSRHESGFAIDIDRNSASAMEGCGLFKKYGFHRPLSNEPWHVEMIGAGKGGSATPAVAAANASPQLMQSAASQEMDKAAEATMNKAEENTKGLEKTWSQKLNEKGKPPTDSETGGTSKTAETNGAKAAKGVEEEEEEEEVGEPVDDIGENDTKIINKEVMPPTVDVMNGDANTRTPEQQALYEQYLKKAGGDPRGVPDSVANPRTEADRQRDRDELRNNPYGGVTTTPVTGQTGTWSQRNGQNPGVSANGSGTSGQYGQRARPWSQTQTGRAITGAATKIGGVYGMGSFGTMAPGAYGGLRKVDGKVNEVLNKTPGLCELMRLPGMPRIPTVSSGLPSFGKIFSTGADKVAGMFGGDEPAPAMVPASERPRIMNGQRVTYDGPAVTSTDQIGTTSLNAPVASMSPASPTYYNNDAPVTTRSAGAPVATMAAPSQATAMPVAEKVERNTFDGVQKVSIAASDVPMGSGGGDAAPAGGSPGASGAAKNDMPSIDDAPAIMDEYGLLFVNFGMV